MNMRNLAVWGLIAALVVAMMIAMQGSSVAANAEKVPISELRQMATDGQLAEVTVTNDRITAEATGGATYYAEKLPTNIEVSTWFADQGVTVNEDAESGFSFGGLLLNLLPLVLILGLFLFLMRQMQGGGGGRGAMSFGKSRARMLTEKHGKVTFDDVAGVEH